MKYTCLFLQSSYSSDLAFHEFLPNRISQKMIAGEKLEFNKEIIANIETCLAAKEKIFYKKDIVSLEKRFFRL